MLYCSHCVTKIQTACSILGDLEFSSPGFTKVWSLRELVLTAGYKQERYNFHWFGQAWILSILSVDGRYFFASRRGEERERVIFTNLCQHCRYPLYPQYCLWASPDFWIQEFRRTWLAGEQRLAFTLHRSQDNIFNWTFYYLSIVLCFSKLLSPALKLKDKHDRIWNKVPLFPQTSTTWKSVNDMLLGRQHLKILLLLIYAGFLISDL